MRNVLMVMVHMNVECADVTQDVVESSVSVIKTVPHPLMIATANGRTVKATVIY